MNTSRLISLDAPRQSLVYLALRELITSSRTLPFRILAPNLYHELFLEARERVFWNKIIHQNTCGDLSDPSYITHDTYHTILNATMAQPQATQGPRIRRPRVLARQACQADDVSLMSEAISFSSSPIYRDTVEGVLTHALKQLVGYNSTNVLTYILTHGADIHRLSGMDVAVCIRRPVEPSKQTIDLLLAHGWDINAQDKDSWPLLWFVVNDDEFVAWCLERGASVLPKDQPPLQNDGVMSMDQIYHCPPILQRAAQNSTVSTFELLRSRGAPLGRRTLHFAAMAAIRPRDIDDSVTAQPEGQQRQNQMPDQFRDKTPVELYAERMAMVRHLVDTLGLDPNAPDQPEGFRLGSHWGSPLCYVAGPMVGDRDCRNVVWFLLDRGADPTIAIQIAKDLKKRYLLEAVEEWRAQDAVKHLVGGVLFSKPNSVHGGVI